MNTPNEWRLAPVGIALLKGHMGIANKLLRLPQADINFRMEDGKTILLHMLASAAEANKEDEELNRTLLEEIKELVSEFGADASVTDEDGRNGVHYVLAWRVNRFCDREDKKRKFTEYIAARMELQREFFEFFLGQGCSVLGMDTSGKIPLDLALSQHLDQDNLVNSEGQNVVDLLIEGAGKYTTYKWKNPSEKEER